MHVILVGVPLLASSLSEAHIGLKLPLRLGPGLAIDEYPLELRFESEVVRLLPEHEDDIGTAIVYGLRYCIPECWLVILYSCELLFICPSGETLPAKQDIDLESFKFGEESASDSSSDIGVTVIEGPRPLVMSKDLGLFVCAFIDKDGDCFLSGGGEPKVTPVHEYWVEGKSAHSMLIS